MRKLFVLPALLVVAGCSSTGGDSQPVELMEETVVEPVDAPPSEMVKIKKEDQIPEWYIKLPEDTETSLYGSGSGLSGDLQFSMDKAMHQAKIILGDKMSNKVSMQVQSYIADNSTTGGRTIEDTKKVSKSGFKNVDVSAYKVVEKAVFRERSRFRAYILLEIDPSDRPITIDTVTPVELNSVRNDAQQALDNL
jgi:hypothetical protein